jgi:hypothetical protein
MEQYDSGDIHTGAVEIAGGYRLRQKEFAAG